MRNHHRRSLWVTKARSIRVLGRIPDAQCGYIKSCHVLSYCAKVAVPFSCIRHPVNKQGYNVKERNLLGGLIRFHILYHASHGPIFGLGIIEELARHGYKLSAGTIYPILHGMEKEGLLVSKELLIGGRNRRTYVATGGGVEVLANAKAKVWELFRELFEEELQFGRTTHATAKKPARSKR